MHLAMDLKAKLLGFDRWDILHLGGFVCKSFILYVNIRIKTAGDNSIWFINKLLGSSKEYPVRLLSFDYELAPLSSDRGYWRPSRL